MQEFPLQMLRLLMLLLLPLKSGFVNCRWGQLVLCSYGYICARDCGGLGLG